MQFAGGFSLNYQQDTSCVCSSVAQVHGETVNTSTSTSAHHSCAWKFHITNRVTSHTKAIRWRHLTQRKTDLKGLMEPLSLDWHIWQTFVECRYLPRLGNASSCTNIGHLSFRTDVPSEWHKPNSRIFVVYTCCCIPTTRLLFEKQWHSVSLGMSREVKHNSNRNATTRARITCCKCTGLRFPAK